MSSFVIKIIAIFTMLLDHFADVFSFIPNVWVLNVIGRIAFPLFAFQLFIGYSHTKNMKKYFLRLIAFAFISQVPFSLLIFIMTGSFTAGEHFISLNIFFTLALGLLAMYIYDSGLNKFVKILIISLLLAIAQVCNVDYGPWGVGLILFIRVFYPNIKSSFKSYAIFIIGFLLFCILRYAPYFKFISNGRVILQLIFTFLPSFLMLFYNGKKGASLKYFFYVFYPLHLIILDFLGFYFIAPHLFHLL